MYTISFTGVSYCGVFFYSPSLLFTLQFVGRLWVVALGFQPQVKYSLFQNKELVAGDLEMFFSEQRY